MDETSLIGRKLAGRFQITGVIGEGGMATVYRGVQEAEPHSVAVKVMSPELARDKRFVRRFRREAKAAAMLAHPNTVAILEYGEDGELVYLAMECVEGHDLSVALHRERRIPELRAAKILIQVCEGLGAAHKLNIVHRDLKPDNVMLIKGEGAGADERVKVLDFGIAKILDDTDGPALGAKAEPPSSARSMLTRVGTIVGTPAYMSPEQGRAEPVDARTDLYSCGVLLYELITGKTPFDGETPMQVVMRHVNEAPKPPSTFVPVHPGLEALIMKALAKYSAQRQQSAEEMAGELRKLLPELADARKAPNSAPLSPTQIQRSPLAAPRSALPPSALPASASLPTSEPPTVLRPGAPPAAKKGGAPAKTINMSLEDAGTGDKAPLTGKAPAFPTLNINLPDDLELPEEDDISTRDGLLPNAAVAFADTAKGKVPSSGNGAPREGIPSSDAVTTKPKASPAPPSPTPPAKSESEPPPSDDDDDETRTLVAQPRIAPPSAEAFGDTLVSPFGPDGAPKPDPAAVRPAAGAPAKRQSSEPELIVEATGRPSAPVDLGATIPLVESPLVESPLVESEPPPEQATKPQAPAAPVVAAPMPLPIEPLIELDEPRIPALPAVAPAPPPLWSPSAQKRRPGWVAPAAIALGVLLGATVFAVLMAAIVLWSR